MPKNATRLPAALCPHCGYHVDAASPVDGDDRPEPGDWTICMRCSGLLVFDAGLRPVLPALGAYDALRITDPSFHAMIEEARASVRDVAARGDWTSQPTGRA